MFLTAIIAAATLQSSGMDALLQYDLHVASPAGEYTVSFHEDGTYTSNAGIEGTWEVVDGELCTTRSTGEHACEALMDVPAEAGTSWTGTNTAGQEVTFTLVER